MGTMSATNGNHSLKKIARQAMIEGGLDPDFPPSAQQQLESIQKAAEPSEGTIFRATVRNQAKLAYDSVAAGLEGKAKLPTKVAAVPGLVEQLRLQERVSQTMKELRHEHGALDLQSIEPRAILSDGKIVGL